MTEVLYSITTAFQSLSKFPTKCLPQLFGNALLVTAIRSSRAEACALTHSEETQFPHYRTRSMTGMLAWTGGEAYLSLSTAGAAWERLACGTAENTQW